MEEKTCVAAQKRKNGKKKRKTRKKTSGKYGEEGREERGEIRIVNKLIEVFPLLPFFHFQNARARP